MADMPASFHYVYACGHMGEFGILLSTGVCAAMFSFRRTDNWLRRLLDRPRAFVTLASGALVIGFVPHLYTLAITIAYLLLAALFYPSVRVMSECKDTDTLSGWAKHPGMLSESYHENHHANLPHEADSGNTDISAQYESLNRMKMKITKDTCFHIGRQGGIRISQGERG